MDRRGESKGILRSGNPECGIDQKTGAREEAEQTEQESRRGKKIKKIKRKQAGLKHMQGRWGVGEGGKRNFSPPGNFRLHVLPLCKSASPRGAEARA